MCINHDSALLISICVRYSSDKWSLQLLKSLWDSVTRFTVSPTSNNVSAHMALEKGWLDECLKTEVTIHNNLLYVGEHLVIPCIDGLCEQIFCLAHDTLSHFDAEKLYAFICEAYYWPNLQKE